MRQIQDNDLEYLQFFVEFTKISQQKGDDANTTQKQREPFQKLVFVVRDWPHKRNHGYGIEGGKTYLRDECKIGTKKGESSARKDLPDTFKTIDCFLMPYPGQKVDSPEDDFAGQLKDMEDPFKKNVRKLVEHVCKNLVPKTYNGKSHTGETLLEHIKTCYRIMKGAKLDLTKTLVELISEDQNTQIRDACVTSFTVKLEQELENNITEQELENNITEQGLENNITPDEKFKKKVKVIKEELVQKSKLEFIGSSDCTQSSEKKLLKAMNEKENHYINLTRKVNEQLKKAEAEMKQYIEKTPEKKDSEEDSEEIQNICDNALKNIGIYLGDSSDKVLETVRNRLARLAKKECNDANNRMEGKVLIYTALGGAGVGGVAGGVAAGSATIIAEAALPMVALATGGTALIGAVAIGLLSFGIAKFKANIDTKQHEKRE